MKDALVGEVIKERGNEDLDEWCDEMGNQRDKET